MDPIVSNNVPPPTRRGGVRGHIRALEPGQSAFFAGADHRTIRSAASYVAAEFDGERKFAVSKTTVDKVDGVAVWRLKPEGDSNGKT